MVSGALIVVVSGAELIVGFPIVYALCVELRSPNFRLEGNDWSIWFHGYVYIHARINNRNGYGNIHRHYRYTLDIDTDTDYRPTELRGSYFVDNEIGGVIVYNKRDGGRSPWALRAPIDRQLDISIVRWPLGQNYSH
jgi:hypothetical protein